MQPAPADLLKASGLRVTKQRVAVMTALADVPHAEVDTVLGRVRNELGRVSTQAIYDVVNTLTERGVLRRIQPAGSSARYELRVGDNHHHVVCRICETVTDVDCATDSVPCLEVDRLDDYAPGFVVDEAEVIFWGVCAACSTESSGDRTPAEQTRQPDEQRGGQHG